MMLIAPEMKDVSSNNTAHLLSLIDIFEILAYFRRIALGQATENWPLSPSVFLAMFAAVGNTSVRFALPQAAPLA